MNRLAHTGTLVRFIVRRDRTRIAVWVGGIVVLTLVMAASVKGLYPTQADLDEAAEASHGNAAAIAFNGPDQGLDTLGGQVAFQLGTMCVIVALMSIFMIGRETRAEEEAGRLELIRSMPAGDRAPTAAALVVTAAMDLAVGVLVAVGFVLLDLPVAGSIVFGAGLAVLGLAFAGVALVAAQITENTRMVYGMSAVVLGAAFVLRAVGDVGNRAVSWLSPVGWIQRAQPFAGERWWPLLLDVAFAVVLSTAAVVLATRRDVAAGFIPPRPGRDRAAPTLGSTIGLAVRLQRGTVIGWSVGVFVSGIAFGWIANDIEDFVGDNDTMQDLFGPDGGATLTNSFLAYCLVTIALIGGGFAVSAALRLRSEETRLLAEPLLATPTSRSRWAGAHLAVGVVGSVIVLACAGLGTGLAYGLSTGDLGQVPRLVGAALVYTPALMTLVGVTMLLFGAFPRGVSIAWAVLAVYLVAGLLGDIVTLPAIVYDLSPFAQTPDMPAAGFEVVPIVLVTLVAAALGAAGLAAFQRRDIG